MGPGRTSALLTDLYQLTMMQTYLEQRMLGEAVFEFFVRRLPDQRNFLVAAGLDSVLDYLTGVRFTDEERAWLAGTGRFTPEFVEALASFRFTGDVDAMPEGTVFFADEPILRVVAPLPEAQLVESRIINLLHYQTLVASKAARSVLAAPERLLVDFGLRRAHGAEAGLLSARASWLAGFSGTATTEAGQLYGIPVYGTMAHSYIQACDDEAEAFERFARSHPRHTVLLIDTYDTERAAHRVVEISRKLEPEGIRIGGVRIDSGDLAELARRVRHILDDGGCGHITVFVSGSLDEHRLAELVAGGAPIDGFGIGTRMNTSSDAPYLDCVYKPQEYAGQPRRKRSASKATWPGRKQVWRQHGPDGRMLGDVLGLAGETAHAGEPLLVPVMRGGRRLDESTGLEAARVRVRQQLAALPDRLRSIDASAGYAVTVSRAVHDLAAEVDSRT